MFAGSLERISSDTSLHNTVLDTHLQYPKQSDEESPVLYLPDGEPMGLVTLKCSEIDHLHKFVNIE